MGCWGRMGWRGADVATSFQRLLVGTEDATSLLDLYDDCGMWWWSWRGLT